MGFPSKEYWRGLPFPSPDLPDSGDQTHMSSPLQSDSLPSEPPAKSSGSIAILTRHELLLVLIGVVFVIETLTCIIQRIYYKFTHKRLFLMTPIHHTFEKKGYTEREIVKIFCLIGIIASMISIIFGVIL